MRKSFCYLCGRETGKLHEGLCEKCSAAEAKKELFEFGKAWDKESRIKVPLCSNCFSYYKKSWIFPAEEEAGNIDKVVKKAAEDVILGTIKIKPEEAKATKLPSIKILKIEHKGRKIEVYAEVEGKEAKVEFILQKCRECTKISGGYYEAIIQIRGAEGSEREKSARKNILEMLSSFYPEDRSAFLAREEKVKGGIDIYLGSAKAGKKIARYFKGKYNAETKSSPKLYGRKGGKNLYRITFLIRLKNDDRGKAEDSRR